MKTYNNLFDKIVAVDNIKKAILKAAIGKRDKRVVEYALNHLDDVANIISNKLKNNTWRPLKVHSGKEVTDGKRRIVVCPSFLNEQVIHHAIMTVCFPIFYKKFYTYTCGNIKGRGTFYAKKYIEKKISKMKYACKLDIKKFFLNIRPSLVFKEIRKTIRDKKVLMLFAKILRSNVVCVDGKILKQGVPIGFYTSPFFANIMLTALDHEIKEKFNIKVYVRYMDDMLLLDNNKRKLKKICEYLEFKLKSYHLSFKYTPQVHKFKMIDFIGFKFYKDRVTLRKNIFTRAIRAFKNFKPNIFWARKIVSYIGYFKNTNCGNVFKEFISNKLSVRLCKSIISRSAKHV